MTVHSKSTINNIGMLAELVAKHHGIDCLDHMEGNTDLSCRAINEDLLRYALNVFRSYGFRVAQSIANQDPLKDGYYFYVILDQSLTEEDHASTTTGGDR